MAQARVASVDPATSIPRVQVIAPAPLGATALAALRARDIDARLGETTPDVGADGDVIAWALSSTPTAAAAVELAKICARAAALGRPVCVLAPFPDPPTRSHKTSRAAIERVAALSYLRAHGAAVGHDVDAWLESVVLLVRYGAPRGPHAAVVAPSGSWLEAQALSIAAEMEALNVRPPVIGGDEVTDVVLYDPALGAPPSSTPGMHVPVAPRAELATDPAMLYGARAALAAITILGRASERIAIGLGPAPRTANAELAINTELLQKQLAKLESQIGHLGDHETKVLLRSYGVPITRQVVATTPSAAVKKAREVGYPVEIKPWGHDQPSEPAGCPVEKNVTSDAFVRQAFNAILASANRGPTGRDSAVIVRETPPPGREIGVTLLELPALGWTVVLDAPGAGQLAAPAPLRLLDAQQLAAQIISSRAGDAEPDRAGLANLLRRASHLAVDLAGRVTRIDLPRVIVGGRGSRTLVVDAALELA